MAKAKTEALDGTATIKEDTDLGSKGVVQKEEATSTEESDETIVEETAVVKENLSPIIDTDEALTSIEVVKASDVQVIPENYEQVDFEEDVSFESENEIVGVAVESKYTFSEEVLEAYLESDKQDDRIIQGSRNGNFISSRNHEVYVPLSLFLK